jgi:hypothetical protein
MNFLTHHIQNLPLNCIPSYQQPEIITFKLLGMWHKGKTRNNKQNIAQPTSKINSNQTWSIAVWGLKVAWFSVQGMRLTRQILLLVNSNQSTCYCIKKDISLQQQCWENIKSQVAGQHFWSPISTLITLLSAQNETPSKIFLAVDVRNVAMLVLIFGQNLLYQNSCSEKCYIMKQKSIWPDKHFILFNIYTMKDYQNSLPLKIFSNILYL